MGELDPAVTQEPPYMAQFMLGPSAVEALRVWPHEDVAGTFTLAYHPSLACTQAAVGRRELTLVGHMLNPRTPEDTNKEILDRLLNRFENRASLIEATGGLGGRWLLIAANGRERFCQTVLAKYNQVHIKIPASRRRKPITLHRIARAVAHGLDVPEAALFESPRGRGQRNLPRLAAIYLSRKQAGIGLNAIAGYFKLGHYGSVSGAMGRFEHLLVDSPDLRKRMDKLIKIIRE